MAEFTQEDLKGFKNDIESKLNSFENGSDRLDFIVSFHSTMATLGGDSPLRKEWENALNNFFYPKTKYGTLDKEKFEERMAELGNWNIKNSLETGQQVENLLNESELGHSEDWLSAKLSSTKQSTMNSLFENDILPLIDSGSGILATAYPENEANESYKNLLEKKLDDQLLKMDTDTINNYMVGKAYISGSNPKPDYKNNLENEWENAASRGRNRAMHRAVLNGYPENGEPTEQQKEMLEKLEKTYIAIELENSKSYQDALAKKEAADKKEQEIRNAETVITEEDIEKEKNLTQKNMWSELNLNFINNLEVVKELRVNLNNTLANMGLIFATTAMIEQIEQIKQYLDMMAPVKNDFYNALIDSMDNLKNTLYKSASSDERNNEIETAKEQFRRSCGDYFDSLPKINTELIELPIAQLLDEVDDKSHEKDKQIDLWNKSIEAFNDYANRLRENSGQRKGFFGGTKEDSPEYSAILKSINKLHKQLNYRMVDSETFLKLTNNISDACKKYLNMNEPHSKDGKERYLMVQSVFTATKNLNRFHDESYTKNNTTIGAVADPEKIARFKEDIENKFKSFYNPAERLDFMADFYLTIGDNTKSPYYKAYSEILTDYFLPRNPDGNLDKNLFEERQNELNNWFIQKKLDAGKLIGNMDKIHSAVWITDKMSTTKISQRNIIMQSEILTGTIALGEHTNNLFAEAYPDIDDFAKYFANKTKESINNMSAEEKKLFDKGRSYINDNYAKDVLNNAIAAAKTDAEKEKAVAAKEQWIKKQAALKAIEKKIPEDEKIAQQKKTSKEITDSIDFSFIRDNDIINDLREIQNDHFKKYNLKPANKDFIEQIERTEKILDGIDVNENNEYENMRNEIINLKDALKKYGTSPENTDLVREAEDKMLNSCRAYIDTLPNNAPLDYSGRSVVQLMNAVDENKLPNREAAWDSAMSNFDTFANALQAQSGQRKGVFGEKKNDSKEYSDVLKAVNNLRNATKKGPLKNDDFRNLSDEIKKSCDKYLNTKTPHSEEGKNRYELIQSIWNANSRLSNYYLDTSNPFSMSEDLKAMRNSVAAFKPSESISKKNDMELDNNAVTNDITKRRNSVASMGNRPKI